MPTIRSWIRFSITDQFVCTAVFFSNVFNREAVRAESRSGSDLAFGYWDDYMSTCTRTGPLAAPFRSRPCCLVALPPAPHTRPDDSTGFQHAEPNYRPGRNIPPSTERRRTAQRDEVSNPRLSPLWIPFVSPHTMRGVHEPHSYFSVPSHDVHSRTPLSP